MRVRISLPEGHQETLEIVGPEVTIGRSEECDIVIGEAHVSKRHLRLVQGVVAIDLNSANGTYFQGERMQCAAAIAGGEVLLGQSGIRVEVLEEVEDSSAAADPSQASSATPNEAQLAALEALQATLETERSAFEAEAEAWEAERQKLRQECESLRTELRDARTASTPAPEAVSAPAPANTTTNNGTELNPELRELLASLRSDNSRMLEALAGIRRRMEEQPANPPAPLNTAEDSAAPVSGLFFACKTRSSACRTRTASCSSAWPKRKPCSRRARRLPSGSRAPATTTPCRRVEDRSDDDQVPPGFLGPRRRRLGG